MCLLSTQVLGEQRAFLCCERGNDETGIVMGCTQSSALVD